MPAVSNTSPIFNLACIDRLELLREQFGEVWIPLGVETELSQIPDVAVRQTINRALKDGWLRVRATTDESLVQLLSADLHLGEAEAIALAAEMVIDWTLIDERDGRAKARQLALKVTGVLGILLRAKNTGRLPAIAPELAALKTKARFFVSPELAAAVLVSAGE